jgi:hypothetical protein
LHRRLDRRPSRTLQPYGGANRAVRRHIRAHAQPKEAGCAQLEQNEPVDGRYLCDRPVFDFTLVRHTVIGFAEAIAEDGFGDGSGQFLSSIEPSFPQIFPRWPHLTNGKYRTAVSTIALNSDSAAASFNRLRNSNGRQVGSAPITRPSMSCF